MSGIISGANACLELFRGLLNYCDVAGTLVLDKLRLIQNELKLVAFPWRSRPGEMQGPPSKPLDHIGNIKKCDGPEDGILNFREKGLENIVIQYFAKDCTDVEYRPRTQQAVRRRYGTATTFLFIRLAHSILHRRERLQSRKRARLESPPVPELLAGERVAIQDAHASGNGCEPIESESVGAQQDDDFSTISSSGSGGMFFLDDVESFPDPPEMIGSTCPCCPYCAAPLQQSDLEWTNWCRHVLEDFQPFVCLSDTCEGQPPSFGDFESWVEHMTTLHSETWAQKLCPPSPWECHKCDPVMEFQEEADFTKHLNVEHRTCKEDEKSSIYEMSKAMRESRQQQHICAFCKDRMEAKAAAEFRATDEPEGMTCSVLCDMLNEHFACHLCSLAFDTAEKLNEEDYILLFPSAPVLRSSQDSLALQGPEVELAAWGTSLLRLTKTNPGKMHQN